MDTHGNKNYFKIAFIFLDIVTKHLRNIFRQEWDTHHPNNPWHDDNNSLQYLKTKAKRLGTWESLKNLPKSGDRDKWDATTLFSVLLYSKTINLSKAKWEKIDKLRKIRNKYFAHPPTTSISKRAFRVIYQDIKICMISLMCSKSVQKQMEDVKNEIIKVPEDYMKEMEAKLYVIKTLETNNNKLLMQLVDLLKKYGNAILFLLIVIIVVMVLFYLPMLFLHPSNGPIYLFTRTKCNNSKSFFPESQKPAYYIGHELDINTGANVLANGSYSMVSITGPPAIGKTATAVAVGQVLKNSHGYQVAFVDFKQINVSSSCIRTDIYKYIVRSIDYELENVPHSVQEFNKWLMLKITKCPTLLLFDNIENILNSTSKSMFYEVTKECLAIKIKILTTSRKEFDIVGVAIYSIKLEPLPLSQSTGLLFKLSPEFQHRSSVKKIAEKIGGIPLLLEVTGSLIRSKYYEEAELLTKFEELPILVVLNDTKDMTESSNYYTLLKIVFDGLDPGLQFTLIAFGAVPIIFNQTSADAVVNLNFTEKVDLYPLVNYNLLKTFELPSAQRLYGMHPIISEFTRLVIKDHTHWSKLQHTRSGSFMVEESPKCESLLYIIADISDMTIQQSIWEYNVPKILVQNGFAESSERFGMIAFHAALALYELGNYTKSINALYLAMELMVDNNNQLKCLANFMVEATASLKQGKSNLSIQFRKLLLMTLNLIEMDNPCFVATSLLDLDNLSNNTSFHKDAVAVLKHALTKYRQQYEKHNCSKENLRYLAYNLGVSFYYHGQYRESINVLLIPANLLKSHDDQLMSDWLLADSYYKTRDYKTCFQILRRILNSSYEVNYHKQKHVFQALIDLAHNAADTYLNQSNISMTIQFSILSLNTLKMLETDSCYISSLYFRVGLTFYNLMHVYKIRTFHRDAAFAFNQTWTFIKKNECDEDLGLVAYYLGGAYYHCGQYNDSKDVLRIAVDLLEKDDIHQFMANCFLAFSYSEIEEHKTSYQITRSILSNNPYLGTLNSSFYQQDLINLANISVVAAYKYMEQGKINQSIEFSHLYIVTLEMVDESSCLIASQYCNLSLLYFVVQRHADAAIALNKALELFHLNVCDDQRVGVLAIYFGNFFYKIGNYHNSIEVLLGTIDLLKTNPDQQFLANYILFGSYLKLHDYESVIQLLRKVFDSSYIDQVDHLRYKQELEILRKFARTYKILKCKVD